MLKSPSPDCAPVADDGRVANGSDARVNVRPMGIAPRIQNVFALWSGTP